jgi:hypothetical protein
MSWVRRIIAGIAAEKAVIEQQNDAEHRRYQIGLAAAQHEIPDYARKFDRQIIQLLLDDLVTAGYTIQGPSLGLNHTTWNTITPAKDWSWLRKHTGRTYLSQDFSERQEYSDTLYYQYLWYGWRWQIVGLTNVFLVFDWSWVGEWGQPNVECLIINDLQRETESYLRWSGCVKKVWDSSNGLEKLASKLEQALTPLVHNDMQKKFR